LWKHKEKILTIDPEINPLHKSEGWGRNVIEEVRMKRMLMTGALLLSLTLIVSTGFAQMGGGMMEGGQGQMMGPEKSQEPGVKGGGEKIFNDHCGSCHPDGENVIVPDLPLRGSRVLANFKTFAAFIRNPKMPDGSQGSMPSFDKSKISTNQARQLYHYIRASEWSDAGDGRWMNHGMMRGYGVGAGMMGGYGMGPGMMGGYGMGPGMMGGYGMGGYGMGPGMMGYSRQSPECQKFYDDTAQLRKELHDKRFEYFETLRNPKTTMGTVSNLQKEMWELQEKIYSKAPLGCGW
jgi:mono/diheme cytochrome c family protein